MTYVDAVNASKGYQTELATTSIDQRHKAGLRATYRIYGCSHCHESIECSSRWVSTQKHASLSTLSGRQLCLPNHCISSAETERPTCLRASSLRHSWQHSRNTYRRVCFIGRNMFLKLIT